MAEPFTPEQLDQFREILDTIPLARTLLEIAKLLGFETWDPGDQAQESFDFLIQSEVDTQGLVRDLHTPNRPWITDLIAAVAAIKAKTDAHLPVPAYPTPPTAAINAAAVWDVVAHTSFQANFTYTMRQVMSRLGYFSEYTQNFGRIVRADNPDYFVAHLVETRFTGTFGQWDVTTLRPRLRPDGESVLAYHQRVQPAAGWAALGTMVYRYIMSPTNTIVAWLCCEVSDVPAEKHPAMPAPPADPAIGDMSARLRQYLPLWGEGVTNGGFPIEGEGAAVIPAETASILVDLTAVPSELARYGDDGPWYATLGSVVWLMDGGFAEGTPLHRANSWLRVPPGANGIHWWLRPGVTGGLTFIGAAPA